MPIPSAILPLALLTGLLLSQNALADRSLAQIDYALFQNPNADVQDDLRALVERGDYRAMRMLGDMLGGSSSTSKRDRLALYQRSFAQGRGEIRALGSMARMMETDTVRRVHYRPAFQQALTQFPHERDLQTLASALDVFLIYPSLFSPQEAEELLRLHERSCLLDCDLQLYRAVLAESLGDRPLADKHYRAAVMVDGRAAERYYHFLGEQQNQLFAQFALQLEPHREAMSADAVHRVGMVLDRIAEILRVDERLAERQRRAAAKAAGTELEPMPPDATAASDGLRQRALGWVDHAAARSWVPAMATRLYFMTSYPDDYSGAEAMQLIDRVAELEPSRAPSLRVEALMVTNWDTLNPQQAHQIIQQMISQGNPDGKELLGDLYNKGGLDEPDQQRALQIYQELSAQGIASAYFRQARVYASAPAFCSDPVQAYALAGVAYDMGLERARSLMRELNFDLSDDERAKAESIRADILQELTI
ncbi:sel1 repeat family protein [Pseudomonas neustonica]|uniref:Sel1 repeat family protein n=1 Tax=Pseudomonas neustonica TaxID=2487346 RepID=A0ABX9XF18_9PSED|nr:MULTISPECIES: sel1 repeat family protein [Pseudomonas]MAB24165.1 hypothetical protein [Pseudomonadales bacterium]ROZ81133.1 sel1 repeat family protein [Pseudomonas sp. SSM44]ROZ82358.1 sel1 repeat family protein [Pseudomonas neustonica]|tara:strand:- start:9208 stop:10644 length:1437 start_codon:yes stop_codon:yes gene_type:complete